MYIFTQPRAAKQTGPTERKSGGYVIAPKSHLTAKKRHLSLSLIVLQVLQITHTRFFLRSVEVPECTFSLNPAPPSRLGRLSRPPVCELFFLRSVEVWRSIEVPEYLQKWGLRNRSQIPSDSEKTTSLYGRAAAGL